MNRRDASFEWIKKWLWCSWAHKLDRCYPEVWEPSSDFWHCTRCHPCGEGLDRTDDPIEFSWQSTPQLWCAHRKSYDGAPDAHCPIGFGRTKEEAAAELLEAEELQGD